LETWRYINTGPLDGATNMAIDMALAQCMTLNGHYPVLRVYGWNPPAVSLGYHQKLLDINKDLCRQDGIDVVFRPTGGRAILHGDELTYAVILPKSGYFAGADIHKIYELISRCLISALNSLDFKVSFDRAEATPHDFSRGELSTLCYAAAIRYEICYQKKKLVGSAQRQFENAILQHGSILIGPYHLELTRYLAQNDAERRRQIREFLENKTVCLNDISNHPVTFSELAVAVKNGFSRELDIKFLDTELTERELEKVHFLLEAAKHTS